MTQIVRYTTPEGLFQFKSQSEDLSLNEPSELNHLNAVWRDVQTRWPKSRPLFENGFDPYDQFCLSLDFLLKCDESAEINMRYSTYLIKHHVEQTAPYPVYIGQVYVLLAACYLGFDVKAAEDGTKFHLNIVMDDKYWNRASAEKHSHHRSLKHYPVVLPCHHAHLTW